MNAHLKSIFAFFPTSNKKVFLSALWRSINPNRNTEICLKTSLSEAYKWLCIAQDATPDDGVSAWYDLLRGWELSYPETTGYIIPTFFKYAEIMEDQDAKKRGYRMADWEIEVQLSSGAVRSGSMASKEGPAVFNTGQVLFGWVSAYRETGEIKYIEAINKASSWLLKMQDEDGAWRKSLSLKTKSKVQTYNVRAAWGLAMGGQVLDKPEWIKAAKKNCDWALTQQNKNGWFANNSFSENEPPLLHTIGYVLEGLIGIGKLLDDQKYIRAAKEGIDPLIAIYKKNGYFSGWYDSNWVGPPWRCLTGEAQIALSLIRLSKYYRNDYKYYEVGHAILEDIAKTQIIKSRFDVIRGAIAGSQPIWGPYIPYCYLNWAAKFFMDAIILDIFETDVC